jgi:hypothetical protein
MKAGIVVSGAAASTKITDSPAAMEVTPFKPTEEAKALELSSNFQPAMFTATALVFVTSNQSAKYDELPLAHGLTSEMMMPPTPAAAAGSAVDQPSAESASNPVAARTRPLRLRRYEIVCCWFTCSSACCCQVFPRLSGPIGPTSEKVDRPVCGQTSSGCLESKQCRMKRLQPVGGCLKSGVKSGLLINAQEHRRPLGQAGGCSIGKSSATRARSSCFNTLPAALMGNSSTTRTMRGAL